MHPKIAPAGLLFLLLASPLALAQSPCGAQVTVESGDTLGRIANRCEVTLNELLAANPQIDNPNLISVGMTLTVPGAPLPAAEPAVIRPKPAPQQQGPSVGEMVGIREVRGTLTDQGVECQALQGDDGQLYTLTGDLQGLETGQRVYVRGRVAEMSFCQQGTTLGVAHIEPLEP